ncbi:MAG: 2-dehydropantoate 2-reductase [Candidatus Hydrogenedens sp.]|nr:2-dehydropantoate 2-reductase [Candidatus Hydrogenedentota bacterium]NLF58986.1 2-dehydropantoate 2-reductase [Candidatus Hydrogenedens sp.]
MSRVAVIGPGAMGCLFAAKLARSGVRVHLVDHNPQRAESLSKTGIHVEEPDGTLITERVTATILPPQGMDLVLVMTKAHSTAALKLPPDAPVLTLQNGLGNVDTLCAMAGSARILAGTSSEAATLLGPGRVRHAARGRSVFGSWTSCPTEVAYKLLRDAGFGVDLTDTPGQMIWEKAVMNAGINPLTALLDVPNGRLLEIPDARRLMRDLVTEATKVAATEGYRFSHSLVEAAEDLCRQTRDNISSMLQDVRNRKKTEIGAISGEILRRAELAALSVPRTRVIYQLVRGLESR